MTLIYPKGSLMLSEGRQLNFLQAHLSLEISGLSKSFGFPVIDYDLSCDSVLTTPKAEISIDKDSADHIRDMFVKVFCREYFKKHHTWPPLTMMYGCSDELRRSINSESWQEQGMNGWDVDLFKRVTLGKCLEFDYKVDESSLIKDTSIIPSRCNLRS